MLKEVEDLLAGLKLTPEERTQVEAILTSDDRQKEIKRGYHGAAETDRLMGQARAAEEVAKAKAIEADQKVAGWLKWYDEEAPKLDSYMSAAQQAENKLNALRGYLVGQGLDPDAVIGGGAPPPVAAPAPEAFSWDKVMQDPKFTEKFIPRDEAQQSLNAVLQLGDVQHKLNLRHQQLYGKPIDDFATLRQEAFKANKPLDAYADEKFGFQAKQAELDEAALQQRVDRLVQEKYAAEISKRGIPQPTGDIAQDGVDLFTDTFTNKSRVSDGEATRLAVEKALAFDAANPNHDAKAINPQI